LTDRPWIAFAAVSLRQPFAFAFAKPLKSVANALKGWRAARAKESALLCRIIIMAIYHYGAAIMPQ